MLNWSVEELKNQIVGELNCLIMMLKNKSVEELMFWRIEVLKNWGIGQLKYWWNEVSDFEKICSVEELECWRIWNDEELKKWRIERMKNWKNEKNEKN